MRSVETDPEKERSGICFKDFWGLRRQHAYLILLLRARPIVFTRAALRKEAHQTTAV